MLRYTISLFALGAVAALSALGGLDGSSVLPADHEAIGYSKITLTDPVSKLVAKLAFGKTKLEYDQTFGYLPAVLRELQVPESSQVLVFSKTSFQATRISPRMPRALYFNDQVAVGYVRGGDVVEFTAVDPVGGIIFYTLDQDPNSAPKPQRQEQCLQCHASGSTLGVPGLVVRSLYPDRNGMPIFQAGSFISDHRSSIDQRWGGWYVTGKGAGSKHMGNAIYTAGEGHNVSGEGKTDITDLKEFFDTGAYLRPTSDIIALLVLEHQTRMTNLITRVGWEARMALHDRDVMNKALGEPAGTPSESCERRINNAAEELVKYMLMTDEAALPTPISGTSGFAEDYAHRPGTPKDKQGRSLRELDLKTRLFRYQCSPLIYSEAFKALLEPAKTRVIARIREIVTGHDTTAAFAKLSTDDRKTLHNILTDTGIL